MGKLIVIEGLDGSGKATQSKLLSDKINSEKQSIKITFPDYDSPACGGIKMYLNGELGENANDVNAYAASLLYAVDRFASYKKNWQEFYLNDGVVVADRYTTSNAVHQCSKLDKTDWDEYLNWLFELEYNKVKIPTPDLVIYLDMSPNVSQKLMSKRYNDDETKKDIHEKDLQHLQNSRNAALYACEKLGWKKVMCDDGENAFSIEKISEIVYNLAKQVL